MGPSGTGWDRGGGRRWDPKELLRQISAIYLHLSDVDAQSAFAYAVAADGRSYSDACFAEAAHVLRQLGLASDGDAARLEAFAERVRACAAERSHEEEEMGEVPDEFLDELMATLMEDPVKLPSGANPPRPAGREPPRVRTFMTRGRAGAQGTCWTGRRSCGTC